MTTLETNNYSTLCRMLDERWSCRGFTDQEVPRRIIEQVLDAARHTPSWCNTQPWHVTVTAGAGTERFRTALAEHAAATVQLSPDFDFPERYSGIHQERRRECAMQLYDSVGVTRGDRAASAQQTARNFRFFDAPHVAIITTTAELGTYGAVDCGLYVQTFLLAAQSLGLGAIPQAALAAHSDFVRNYFELPEDRFVVCGISLGYPDPHHPANGFRTRRAAVEDTYRWVQK
jgi:nitroreductase